MLQEVEVADSTTITAVPRPGLNCAQAVEAFCRTVHTRARLGARGCCLVLCGGPGVEDEGRYLHMESCRPQLLLPKVAHVRVSGRGGGLRRRRAASHAHGPGLLDPRLARPAHRRTSAPHQLTVDRDSCSVERRAGQQPSRGGGGRVGGRGLALACEASL